jgi:Uma2 family endonuclease
LAQTASIVRLDDGRISNMAARHEATIDDLYRAEGKAEIVDGEIVLMSAASGLHGYASGRIYASLLEYERRTKGGHAMPDNVGFVVNLPRRRSFSPDAAFTLAPLTRKFIEGAPIFAAEVRSDEDYGPVAERAMARKRTDYFAAGTLVVWDVDTLEGQVVRAFRAGDPLQPVVYKRDEHAVAEPALPGWSMPVADLFPE